MSSGIVIPYPHIWVPTRPRRKRRSGLWLPALKIGPTGKILLTDDGNVADGDNCCCGGPSGICCRCNGTCYETDQTTCEENGDVWHSEGQGCDPKSSCPSCCRNETCAEYVTSVSVSLNLTGSVASSGGCTPIDCGGIAWNYSLSCSHDLHPCSPDLSGSIGACGISDFTTTGITSCPTSTCGVSPAKRADIELTVSVHGGGLVISGVNALIACTCPGFFDCGYDTFSSLMPKPNFGDTSSLWCGWDNAAGSYHFSDTVTWTRTCPPDVIANGNGTATWDLTVVIS